MVDDAAHAGLAGPGTQAVAPPGGRVLLVDDEAVFAEALRRLLSHEHDVTLVTGGRAALELLRSGARFDVILCDLVMPDVSGIELYAELRRIAPDQANRIIFLTGGGFSGRAQQFLDNITNHWFEKPCNLQELRAAIRRAVVAEDNR